MSDLEKLHAEILALGNKIRREIQKALNETEKKYGKERDRKRKELQAKCAHEFIIEARSFNDDYHSQCGCFYQPDPHRHSKAYFRACCVCGLTESSKGIIGSGVFEKLVSEPFVCYYESVIFDAEASRLTSLSLSELRTEAARLRKLQKKESER